MDIPLSSDALDIAFHPNSNSNLIAAGLISGKVQLIDYNQSSGEIQDDESGEEGDEDESEEESLNKIASTSSAKITKPYTKKWTKRLNNKSCRGVTFNDSGDSLYTLSKDGTIFCLDSESGKEILQWTKAHSSAPSRIEMLENGILATGDDDGVVSLWDSRNPSKSNSVFTYSHHFDWITSLLWCKNLTEPKKSKAEIELEKKRKKKKKNKISTNEAENDNPITTRERLVVTSGDGTLSVIDVRAGKSGVQISEDQEDELLSIASIKNDSKLVVGTQLGILSLWSPSKGLLDHIDRIPGHPSSVDSICKFDNDTILTGSSDGLVRLVQILPHKLLGIIADHDGMPIEKIIKKDNFLASIGHGAEIKLTDLKDLFDSEGEDDEVDEDKEGNEIEIEGEIVKDVENEDEEEEDSSSSSSSNDDEQPRSKKSRKAPPTISKQIQQSTSFKPSLSSDFFADL